MTVEAYAIGVAAKLEDGVTPPLLRIIEALTRANGLMTEFAGLARRASYAGASLGRGLDKAAAGAVRLGDSAGALTRASYILDTMAASSLEIANNMRSIRTAQLGMGRIPVIAGGGDGRGESGSGPRYVGGGRGGYRGSHTLRNGAVGSALLASYGIYENAKLQDINLRAAVTNQTPTALLAQTANIMRGREFAYAQKYGFVTGGSIEPYAGAILEASRLLRTLPHNKQILMTNQVMPYVVAESYLKQIPLPEAMSSFIGLAHQAQAYTPEKAYPLYKAMLQASLTTHQNLQQITRAASYAMPALVASGANAPDVLYLLATMMQAGILNTKSGTWLNAMAMNALPNTLGSGLFQNKLQNLALTKLGLYKNGQAQFYKNGHFDLMQEVAILAAARQHMDALTFNAATRRAFGLRGQRAASLFSEAGVVSNLHALMALAKYEPKLGSVDQILKQIGTANVARQTAANAKMTLMNATVTFMTPVNAVLRGASHFFADTAQLAQKHPVAGGIGLIGTGIVGLIAGKLAWKGIDLAAGLAEKELLNFASALTFANGRLGILAATGTAAFEGMRWLLHHTSMGKKLNSSLMADGEWLANLINPIHNPLPVHVHNHTTVLLNGEEFAHSVLHDIKIPQNHGPTGINPLRAPLQPSLTIAP